MSDGSEWESGWETDTEDEEQNEGLSTPAERHNLKPSISPDGVIYRDSKDSETGAVVCGGEIILLSINTNLCFTDAIAGSQHVDG